VDSSVRDVRVSDLLAEFVGNLYAGNRIYGPDTPVGKPIFTLAKRLDRLLPIIRFFGLALPFESLHP